MSSSPNHKIKVANLQDLRIAREAALWKAQLVIKARGPIQKAMEAGDHVTVLGLLQGIADECYLQGIKDHQKVVTQELAAMRGEVN